MKRVVGDSSIHMTEIREKQVVKVEPATAVDPLIQDKGKFAQVNPTINHRVSKINLSADEVTDDLYLDPVCACLDPPELPKRSFSTLTHIKRAYGSRPADLSM